MALCRSRGESEETNECSRFNVPGSTFNRLRTLNIELQISVRALEGSPRDRSYA
jgi:hypothetical protein